MSVRRRAVLSSAVTLALAVTGGCTGATTARSQGSIVRPPTTTPAPTTATTAVPTTTAAPTGPAGSAGAVEIPPGSDMYVDPPTLTAEAPGTLLRYQAMATRPDALGFVAPGQLWRVMYVSSDADGRPIPVTGTIRVPDATAPAGGWPVVSWAHGTTGAADRCAPSKQDEVAPIADLLAFDGVVVAATDYAGLGTPGLHPYLDGPSAGRAALDIIPAADGLPGATGGAVSRRFVLWGHSQGGHAVLFARQMAAERLPDRELVGTVAWAPVALLADAVSAILVALQPKGLGVLAVTTLAVRRTDVRLDSVLTPWAMAVALPVVDSGCIDDVSRGMQLLGSLPVVTTPPNAQSPWREHLALNEPAMLPGTAPLLLVQAADDPVAPPAMSAAVKARTCSRAEPTQRWLLATGGHSVVVGDTRPVARRWTLDRLIGVPAPSGCGLPDGTAA